MYAFDRDNATGRRAPKRPSRGGCRRLAIEWIEQRWMLSASMGVDWNDVALAGVDGIASDVSSDWQSDAAADEGMIELSCNGMATRSAASTAAFYSAGGVYAVEGVFATVNGSLDLPLAEPSLSAPPLQRILDVGPSAPSDGGDVLSAERPAESTFGDRAMEKSVGASPDTASAATDHRMERPRPIVGVLTPSCRPDGGGMIDITPRPGQPEVLLARDDPPGLDRAPLLARDADAIGRPGAEPSDSRAEKNSPAMRVEGSQGRGQAFDLAWRAAESPTRAVFDAGVGGASVVWTGASIPAERVPGHPLPAERSVMEPSPSALPEAKAVDLAPAPPTVTDETVAALDEVAVASPGVPGSHDAALCDVSQWLVDCLPRLAMAEARRAREFIPLVVLATVGQYHAQAALPDRAGPSELLPPRRKGR